MILSIVGKKSTQTILEFGGLQYDHTNETAKAKYLDALSINYNTEISDISLCVVEDSGKIERMKAGDSCSPVWENGEIVGLDFSEEDAKTRYALFVDDSTIVLGESVSITLNLYESDEVTPLIQTGTLRVPMRGPDGVVNLRIDYTDGEGTKTFTPSKAGQYSIGAMHIDDMRMAGEALSIEVDL